MGLDHLVMAMLNGELIIAQKSPAGPVGALLRRGSREILRCGLKCTTPRLVYASLVASERKLRMTEGRRMTTKRRPYGEIYTWFLAISKSSDCQ
jgi:hypothetical protein